MSGKKLYLFVGYPGAGKTTVSKIIAAKTGAVHLWADEVRQQMFGKARLSDSETTQLYDALNQETASLLGAGKSVIFDTNFNFSKDRDSLRALAAEHQAEPVLLWLKTPLEVARARATNLAAGPSNRVWGKMPEIDFARISNNLQPPTAAENPVIFEDSVFNEALISERLGL